MSMGSDDDAVDEPTASDSFFEGVRDVHRRADEGQTGGDESVPDRRRTRTDSAGEGTQDSILRRTPAEAAPHSSHPAMDTSCPATAAIAETTALGSIEHVGPAIDRRYGTARRVRHTRATGTSRRVEVRACRVPETERTGFTDALLEQLHRWTAISDLDGVVPIRDRGGETDPWVVTGGTGPTLCGRDTPSVPRGLQQARSLADALARLHDRGIVHAGIDPGNVVMAVDDGSATPALDNPGLVDVYRRYEDPAAVLDPRYAAPEYFEANRGIVDRTTDIYGLGVVCFRLLTGVAPIAGSPQAIADRVTDEEPLPRPSQVDPRLPDEIDDVILTATATEKFQRYETARDFHDALSAVTDAD